jgi:hypothetical protein
MTEKSKMTFQLCSNDLLKIVTLLKIFQFHSSLYRFSCSARSNLHFKEWETLLSDLQVFLLSQAVVKPSVDSDTIVSFFNSFSILHGKFDVEYCADFKPIVIVVQEGMKIFLDIITAYSEPETVSA